MITDCIAPVITEAGIGTIVTLDGRNILSEGLKFAKTTIQTIQTKLGDQYYLRVQNETQASRALSEARRLFGAPDTAVFTIDGWKMVSDITINKKTEGVMIRTLQYACTVCGMWYTPPKPYASYCSVKCYYVDRNDPTKQFRSINKEMVDLGLVREYWCEMFSLKKIILDAGVEGIMVTEIDGADGTYINGLLISNKFLLEKHGVTG